MLSANLGMKKLYKYETILLPGLHGLGKGESRLGKRQKKAL